MNKKGVFVINQNVDLKKIIDISGGNELTEIYILSTHYLFRHERQFLLSEFKGRAVEIQCFAELINDREMEQCDDSATGFLFNAKYSKTELTQRYGLLFIEKAMYLKNELVYKKLLEKFSPDIIFYGKDLGISVNFWKSVKNSFEIEKSKKTPLKLPESFISGLRRIYSLLNGSFYFRKYNCTISILEDTDYRYIFFEPISRINHTDESVVYTTKKVLTGKNACDFIKEQEKSTSKKIRIASTIHNYRFSFYSSLKREVFIFTDGFFPSNYTRSYIDSYTGTTIVPSNPINTEWFRKYNFKLQPAPGFIVNKTWPEIRFSGTIHTVLFILQPGGDWSSLISRSDTDIFLSILCEQLVPAFPDLNFIVRPHPAMTNPNHDGINSLERVREYIEKTGASNLKLSDRPLSEDLQEGDIFISEYSNVLSDVWSASKLGIIANFTNRRSFMKDFEDLGFSSVSSSSQLISLIRKILENPDGFIKENNIAIQQYNRLMLAGT